MKTYFGLEVIDHLNGKVVRYSDIQKLPFFEFWLESQSGSTVVQLNSSNEPCTPSETGINLNDWIAFSMLFIETGKHRYMD